MKYSILIIMAIMVFASGGVSKEQGVIIYYTPFKTFGSYAGTKAEELEAKGAIYFAEHVGVSELDEIWAILNNREEGDFDDNHVRAKIVAGDEIIYLDLYGGYNSNLNGVGKISFYQLLKLDKLLCHLTKADQKSKHFQC